MNLKEWCLEWEVVRLRDTKIDLSVGRRVRYVYCLGVSAPSPRTPPPSQHSPVYYTCFLNVYRKVCNQESSQTLTIVVFSDHHHILCRSTFYHSDIIFHFLVAVCSSITFIAIINCLSLISTSFNSTTSTHSASSSTHPHEESCEESRVRELR